MIKRCGIRALRECGSCAYSEGQEGMGYVDRGWAMTLERLGVLKAMHDVCDDVRDFSCIHSLRRFPKSSF